MRAARVHHPARRRGGAWPLAARAQQPGEAADHRVLGRGHACGLEPMDRRFCAAAARTRLDRGSHRRDRVSLGGGTQRALRRDRGRVRPAQGRCHRHVGNPADACGKAGDIGHPDRLCAGGRPGRHRPRRESGATGRQRHRPVGPVSPILPASDSNFCARLSPVCAGWRSWPMSAIPAAVLEMGEVQAAARTLGLEVAHARNPASRGYRARLRGAQGPRGRTLCLCRPAHDHQPDSHQHLGAGRATADDVTVSGSTSKREV